MTGTHRKTLAVIPARSGSRGIADKNMAEIGGLSLIARAAKVLTDPACDWIARRIVSTDSRRYADEAERHGIEAPFLRPPELSTDTATAVDAMIHAVMECERIWNERYGAVLIVEPTCPLRIAEDINACARTREAADADTAVTVSPLDSKFHPDKVLRLRAGRVEYYSARGAGITGRQQLDELYFRNGSCYAMTRECLLEQRTILGKMTVPVVIRRTLVNIDEPADLDLARWYHAELRSHG